MKLIATIFVTSYTFFIPKLMSQEHIFSLSKVKESGFARYGDNDYQGDIQYIFSEVLSPKHIINESKVQGYFRVQYSSEVTNPELKIADALDLKITNENRLFPAYELHSDKSSLKRVEGESSHKLTKYGIDFSNSNSDYICRKLADYSNMNIIDKSNMIVSRSLMISLSTLKKLDGKSEKIQIDGTDLYLTKVNVTKDVIVIKNRIRP